MSAVLAVYASLVVVLCLKMLAISCYQGYYRLRHLAFMNPEDAAVFKRPAQQQERPEVLRVMQAWRNDLENIPLFMTLGGLAVALEAPAALMAGVGGMFTLARVLHTVTYLAQLQPWRTLSYGVGVLCLLGLAGWIIVQVCTGV
ncbi:MAPEG family protein [Pseudomonas xantholysinigenes]|uniref:Microsomal glutathione S-transferase 1 n=1 Tax=Pseudomonas xantholysinigenes TaxID=2745490 RepID=A0A9E6TW64_9PSED|nr:MAPEG family protein [Pseudomonas xantholysinigenes]QXI36876.1 MAPEG family protein [Pseudomonas xantholysinigenes]